MIASAGDRVFVGPATEKVTSAREGRANMQLWPETSFRCGPQALHRIMLSVAPELHACTGPFSKSRARDVLDILLIDLFGRLNMAAVRAASLQLFAERATHDFPPAVRIPTEWGPELEGLAKDLSYPATSPVEIEGRFRALVDAVARSG